MENAYQPHSDPPIINTLADVEAYEREATAEERYPLQTSYDILSRAAELYGDDPVLRLLLTAETGESPRDLSFRELLQRTTQTANALHSMGVREKDAVAIMLPSCLHSHYATWGSQATGISNPINPLLEARHILEIMNTTEARVLITAAPILNDASHWEKVREIVQQVPSLETVMLVQLEGYTASPDDLASSVRTIDFDEAIAGEPADSLRSGREIKGADTASYFHTGGTTGRPKIARVTHRNIAVVSQMVAHMVSENGRLTAMSALPMFHIYGLIAAGIASIYAGRTTVMMTPDGFRNPNVLKNWWHHAARFRVKAFASVPTILAALMQVPVGDNDLSALEDVGSGAAPLPKQLRKEFEERYNVRVTNGYGMTETTCILTRQRAKSPGPEGCVGTRFPYEQIRTVQLDGTKVLRDCEVNETGVLIVRGPNVFSGYLDPDDDAKAWVDGDWFNTGDVAFIDEDGFVTLTGRAKDLIIRGGHNIDPVIIEEPISKHPAVAQVVAVGQPDVYAGELPVVFVQLRPGQEQITEAELLAWCEEQIPERAAVPKRVEFVDEMPVTAVGKFFKPDLRNRAIETVLSEALLEAGIQGRVAARYEQSRGHVAAVRLIDGAQQEAARTTLERYPLAIEFESP